MKFRPYIDQPCQEADQERYQQSANNATGDGSIGHADRLGLERSLSCGSGHHSVQFEERVAENAAVDRGRVRSGTGANEHVQQGEPPAQSCAEHLLQSMC